jgi:hypothetical protein
MTTFFEQTAEVHERSIMNSLDQAIHLLADRIHCPGGSAQERRAHIEAELLPVVRCALRSGGGPANVVEWVRRTLPWLTCRAGNPARSDAETVAGPMTRLLCDTLLQQYRTNPDNAAAFATVVGW